MTTRRDFGKSFVSATAALAMPSIVPSRVLGTNAPSNRLRVAQIGCGRIALDHDMPGVLKSGLADFVAVCDVDARRVAHGKQHLLEKLYRDVGSPAPDISAHRNYRELIDRPDIDAVVISTPDHWHAEIALAAVLAGKDVYLQKPFTMTIAEGILLRDAVART
ncbi:MAG: Gfo/Idh/MocA family protein, partial [Steroidobacteraceae bacterium]